MTPCLDRESGEVDQDVVKGAKGLIADACVFLSFLEHSDFKWKMEMLTILNNVGR